METIGFSRAVDDVALHEADPAQDRSHPRFFSIDVLRGVAMVLMALDHTRDFFTEVRFDPLDLSQTTTALFLTRWITHFCAPTFVFLAGISARLMAAHRPRSEVSRFLALRGLWLIVLEVTVVNFAWTFNFDYASGAYLQVIWTIGVSMLVLSALVYLPIRLIALLSIACIFGHDLTDSISPGVFGSWAPLWSILHVPGPIPHAYVEYALIPWIAIMSLGYVVGAVFRMSPKTRLRMLTLGGLAALALFGALRSLNAYGDPQEWVAQSSSLKTLLQAINVQKYPPSLDYVLVTLGLSSLLLATIEWAPVHWSGMLRTFGRTSLFFYVLHIAVAHLAAGFTGFAFGFGARILTLSDFNAAPIGWGFGLPVIYGIWLLVLIVLYPACRWFAAIKRRHAGTWLSYV